MTEDQRKEYNRKAREKYRTDPEHREKVKAYSSKYRANNSDKSKKYLRDYYIKNREAIRRRKREHFAAAKVKLRKKLLSDSP